MENLLQFAFQGKQQRCNYYYNYGKDTKVSKIIYSLHSEENNNDASSTRKIVRGENQFSVYIPTTTSME